MQDVSLGNSVDDRAHSQKDQIALLIHRLHSLVDGERASMELVRFGGAAIEPLAHFLFGEAPSVIFQPRQWAVEALAVLGAKDVLLKYLALNDHAIDPVVQQAEDAVRNTAARLVTRWNTDDVFELLLTLARKRLLPGVVASLASFKRQEVLPILERALEDDAARPVAIEQLAQYGDAAIDMLVATVSRKRVQDDRELPSSLLRRRAAVSLLSNSRLERTTWPQLRFLLDENDPELVINAAKIAVPLGTDSDKANAVDSVLRVLPKTPWHLKDEIIECLQALYAWGEPLIEKEIAIRDKESPLKRASDNALLTLVRVRQRAKDRG